MVVLEVRAGGVVFQAAVARHACLPVVRVVTRVRIRIRVKVIFRVKVISKVISRVIVRVKIRAAGRGGVHSPYLISFWLHHRST